MPSSKGYTCIVCGTKYVPNAKGAHKAKYCSKACSYEANHNTAKQYERINADTTPISYIKCLLSHKTRSELSVTEVMELWEEQSGKCALTGVPMTFKRQVGTKFKTNLSLDRIEVGGPYIKDNVRLVCTIANKMRLDMSDEELLFWSKRILENAE